MRGTVQLWLGCALIGGAVCIVFKEPLIGCSMGIALLGLVYLWSGLCLVKKGR